MQELTIEDAPRIVVAIGSYIGEGFDHPRLDTLFLAMPISWRGTLQHYVGRLYRLLDSRKVVEVDGLLKQLRSAVGRMVSSERVFRTLGGDGCRFPGSLIYDVRFLDTPLTRHAPYGGESESSP
jgi:hypothetical protein